MEDSSDEIVDLTGTRCVAASDTKNILSNFLTQHRQILNSDTHDDLPLIRPSESDEPSNSDHSSLVSISKDHDNLQKHSTEYLSGNYDDLQTFLGNVTSISSLYRALDLLVKSMESTPVRFHTPSPITQRMYTTLLNIGLGRESRASLARDLQLERAIQLPKVLSLPSDQCIELYIKVFRTIPGLLCLFNTLQTLKKSLQNSPDLPKSHNHHSLTQLAGSLCRGLALFAECLRPQDLLPCIWSHLYFANLHNDSNINVTPISANQAWTNFINCFITDQVCSLANEIHLTICQHSATLLHPTLYAAYPFDGLWICQRETFIAWISKNVAMFYSSDPIWDNKFTNRTLCSTTCVCLLSRTLRLGYPQASFADIMSILAHVDVNIPPSISSPSAIQHPCTVRITRLFESLASASSFDSRRFIRLLLSWCYEQYSIYDSNDLTSLIPNQLATTTIITDGLTGFFLQLFLLSPHYPIQVINLLTSRQFLIDDNFLDTKTLAALSSRSILNSLISALCHLDFTCEPSQTTSSPHTLSSCDSTPVRGSYLDYLIVKSIDLFSQRLFIRFVSVSLQCSVAQTILITANHLNNFPGKSLSSIIHSCPAYPLAVSNRLDAGTYSVVGNVKSVASNVATRARWLGMIVGSALSSLIDPPQIQLRFDAHEMETLEALSYFNLVKISLHCPHAEVASSLDAFIKLLDFHPEMIPNEPLENKNPSSLEVATINSSTSVSGTGKSECQPCNPVVGDLRAYDEPSSDEEDACSVTASKSLEPISSLYYDRQRPPVYIRDLIRRLSIQPRESNTPEDENQFIIALQSSAKIIRRHSNSKLPALLDNVKELSDTLIHLRADCILEDDDNEDDSNDQKAWAESWWEVKSERGPSEKFSLAEFNASRQRALVSLIVMLPAPTCAIFIKAFFEYDLSIAMRVTILSALVTAALELSKSKPSNRLASIAANCFMYPLLVRALHLTKASQRPDPRFKPILPMLIHAATLILYTAGPACPEFIDLLYETWSFILAWSPYVKLRPRRSPALLSAMLSSHALILELLNSSSAYTFRVSEPSSSSLDQPNPQSLTLDHMLSFIKMTPVLQSSMSVASIRHPTSSVSDFRFTEKLNLSASFLSDMLESFGLTPLSHHFDSAVDPFTASATSAQIPVSRELFTLILYNVHLLNSLKSNIVSI